jgi:8-oxo-dGTP pyrophosphatase MutT (NUDIX family)
MLAVAAEDGVDRMRVELLVAGLVRDGGNVLVARQQHGPVGAGYAWALPGGRAGPGELAVEALLREVYEETGLTAQGAPVLRCVGQLCNPTDIRRDDGEVPGPGEAAIVFVYEVAVLAGVAHHAGDPDGDIVGLEWRSLPDAAQLLSTHPFPFNRMVYREALTAAARGGEAVGQCYLRRTTGGEDLAWSGPG